MTASLLAAHLERFDGLPEALPSLRRFVLDLAVRGKLVQQVPGDQPGVKLLERLRLERDRFAQAHGRKSGPSVPPLENRDLPYPLPAGWAWVRVSELMPVLSQVKPSSDFSYIDVSAIDKDAGRVSDVRVVTSDSAPARARKVIEVGDVLYSCVRPYLLNVAVVDAEYTPAPIASTAFAVLRGFGHVLPRYIWLVLRSPTMVQLVEGKMRGQAYPAIGEADLRLLPFPLPPLAEQRRIVAKVDELMVLCDELEAAQIERDSRGDRLVTASLGRLVRANDDGKEAVRESASFYLSRLDRMTTRPGHVTALRGAVMDLAVRGRARRGCI